MLLAAAGFLLYSIVALALIMYLIFWVAPQHGTENVLIYLAICSLAGSFTVTSCKVRVVLAFIRAAGPLHTDMQVPSCTGAQQLPRLHCDSMQLLEMHIHRHT